MSVLLALMVLASLQPAAHAQESAPRKKLIAFGWDTPNPAFVRANIGQMEQQPFDGSAIGLSVGALVFTHTPYPDDAFAQDRADLAATAFTRFTDNFITMGATADQDWAFVDADWASAAQNIRSFAQTAAAGRARGILFDPEPYGYSAWWYNRDRYQGLEFEQAEALVRERGAQFIQIIQESIPDARILTLWGMGRVRGEIEARGFGLRDSPWALYPAFLAGILAGSNDSVRLVDGNEVSYQFTEAQQFIDSRAWIEGAIHVMPEDPLIRQRFDTHVEIAQAVYVDGLLNLRQSPGYIGHYLTSDQDRLLLLEQNVYQALQTSDEYVWIYSENMNWWQNQIPPGLAEAIIRARDKSAAGAPLGFDASAVVMAARAAMDASVGVWGYIRASDGRALENVYIRADNPDGTELSGVCVRFNLNEYTCTLPGGWTGTLVPTLNGEPLAGARVRLENLTEDRQIDVIVP
jgi:hypothetical protein